jgi:oligosaccharide repeat unit polymerase
VLRFDLPTAQRAFFEQPAEQYSGVAWPVFAAVFLATMVVGVYFATATERTGIEMLITYGGEQSVLREFRQQFGASNPYVYAGFVITQVVGPMLIMVAANLWKSNGRLVWGAAALAMFGLLVFTATASLSKAPIIVVILYILANRFLSKWKGGKIRKTAIIVPVTAMLSLGTLGYALTYGESASDALNDTISRIFIAPLVSVHGYLHVYPNIVPFADGLGIGLIARFLGVQNFVTPDVTVGTIIAGPNTGFNSIWSADLWANFGWAGVILGSTFVGAAMLFLDRWCLVRKRSAIMVALYAFMLVSSTQLSEASIFTMLLSGGLVIAPVLAWLLEMGDAGRQTIDGRETKNLGPETGKACKPIALPEGVSD